MTGSNAKGQVVAIQKSVSFNLKNCRTQFPSIMGVEKENVIVSFYHFDSFLIRRIPAMTFYIILREIIFTAPPAFQDRPDIKNYFFW